MYTSLEQFKEEKLKAFREKFPTLYGPLSIGGMESAYSVQDEISSFLSQAIDEAGLETAARICDPGTPGNYRDKSDAWLTPIKRKKL